MIVELQKYYVGTFPTPEHIVRVFGPKWRALSGYSLMMAGLELIARFDHSEGCWGLESVCPVHDCSCREYWEFPEQIAKVTLAALRDENRIEVS